MTTDELELEYYRTVEDLFAAARGVPHVLSSKDFQLLRQWWSEGVPVEAIAAGVAEIVARRRDSGVADPVTSLGYCRHAVRRQATKLAAMRVGASPEGAQSSADLDLTGAAEALGDLLRSRAALLSVAESSVARVLQEFADLVTASASLAPAELEEHLWALESAMLEQCWQQLSEVERADVDRAARRVAGSAADPSARERAYRAARDRELRRRLGLPRLELLGGGAP